MMKNNGLISDSFILIVYEYNFIAETIISNLINISELSIRYLITNVLRNSVFEAVL